MSFVREVRVRQIDVTAPDMVDDIAGSAKEPERLS
jgi:hypothetical protein